MARDCLLIPFCLAIYLAYQCVQDFAALPRECQTMEVTNIISLGVAAGVFLGLSVAGLIWTMLEPSKEER